MRCGPTEQSKHCERSQSEAVAGKGRAWALQGSGASSAWSSWVVSGTVTKCLKLDPRAAAASVHPQASKPISLSLSPQQ